MTNNQADEIYAREIALFATNDGALYADWIKPYLLNLAKKDARGTYDQFKAMKGWRAIANEATRRYSIDHCGHKLPTLTICNKETRNLAAVEIAESYEELLAEYNAEAAEVFNFKANQKRLQDRFFAEVMPGFQWTDNAAIRTEFHMWKDGLHRAGGISDHLVQNACLPAKFDN